MEKATNNINMPSGKFVFISYSSRNQQSADLLREWLKKTVLLHGWRRMIFHLVVLMLV